MTENSQRVREPLPEGRLIRNICRCEKCKDIIESKHRHDFKFCKCKSIFTDGGLDYVRRGGDLENITDMSEYDI
jgi:hypothetical protein